MKEEIADMKLEKAGMKSEINTLTFSLLHFAGSHDEIQFYTAFPSNSTPTSRYEFPLIFATQLNYRDSGNTENRPSVDVKCVPSHMLQTIDEMVGTVLFEMKCFGKNSKRSI